MKYAVVIPTVKDRPEDVVMLPIQLRCWRQQTLRPCVVVIAVAGTDTCEAAIKYIESLCMNAVSLNMLACCAAKNSYAGAARNVALAHLRDSLKQYHLSTGSPIVCFDADDLPHPLYGHHITTFWAAHVAPTSAGARGLIHMSESVMSPELQSWRVAQHQTKRALGLPKRSIRLRGKTQDYLCLRNGVKNWVDIVTQIGYTFGHIVTDMQTVDVVRGFNSSLSRREDEDFLHKIIHHETGCVWAWSKTLSLYFQWKADTSDAYFNMLKNIAERVMTLYESGHPLIYTHVPQGAFTEPNVEKSSSKQSVGRERYKTKEPRDGDQHKNDRYS